MMSDLIRVNENCSDDRLSSDVISAQFTSGNDSDQKLDMLGEVLKQIKSLQEKDIDENISREMEPLSRNPSNVTSNSGIHLTKSAITSVKEPKPRRKMVSFSANDQFYATEYQEPYINEGDIVDGHQHIDIASMITEEETSSSRCTFGALNKATAGSVFDSVSFEDLPLRLSLVESEGPERFSMDQVIQKLINLQFSLQPSESMIAIPKFESRGEEDISLMRNSLLNSKSTTSTIENNYHIPDFPPRDDCIMTTNELMLAASKTLMYQFQLQSATSLDNEIITNCENSKKTNNGSNLIPPDAIVQVVADNSKAIEYSIDSDSDSDSMIDSDNGAVDNFPQNPEFPKKVNAHEVECSSPMISPCIDDNSKLLDIIPRNKMSRSSYVEDNEKLSVSNVPMEETDLSPLMECSSSLPKKFDSVGSSSFDTTLGTHSCTDQQSTIFTSHRKYRTHKKKLFQDKNRFSEDYRGNMSAEMIEIDSKIDRQEIPILRDKQEEKNSNNSHGDDYMKRTHSRISKKNYSSRVNHKRGSNGSDGDDFIPNSDHTYASGERKVSSYNTKDVIVKDKEEVKIVTAASFMESLKIKTTTITKKISKITNVKGNKESSCATTNPCDSRQPSFGVNNTTLTIPLSPDFESNLIRIKPRSLSISLTPQVVPLTASQFRRHERLNRHESVASDMGKGIERYRKWRLFGNILSLWLIVPVVLCFLFYGIIPYDNKNGNILPNSSSSSSSTSYSSSSPLFISFSSPISSFISCFSSTSSSKSVPANKLIDVNMITSNHINILDGNHLNFNEDFSNIYKNNSNKNNDDKRKYNREVSNNDNNNQIQTNTKNTARFVNKRKLDISQNQEDIKISMNVWLKSLIPWILIMAIFSSLCVEIYSSMISEIEFSVVVWEDTPRLYFTSSLMTVTSCAVVQILIFALWTIGRPRNWFAMIITGFITVAAILYRTFYYRKSNSIFLPISVESQAIFYQFLKGTFVLLICSNVIYTIFTTFYTQFGGFKGGFIGFLAALLFPLIRIIISYILEKCHFFCWGCERGYLCATNIVTIITSLLHGVYFSLVCACVSTRWEMILTISIELGIQGYVLYKIMTLPNYDDDNDDDKENIEYSNIDKPDNSNRTRSSLSINRNDNHNHNHNHDENKLDRDDPSMQLTSKTSKSFKMLTNRSIAAIYNSNDIENQNQSKTAYNDSEICNDHNMDDSCTKSDTIKKSETNNKIEKFDHNDIPKTLENNKLGHPSLATQSSSSRSGSDGKYAVNRTFINEDSDSQRNGRGGESRRRDRDRGRGNSRGVKIRRIRTPEDDVLELRLTTWLGMTWITGVLTPLAFLLCSTLLCCGPNRDLFGPNVSVLRYDTISSSGPLFNVKSDIEIIGNYNRIWSVNVFELVNGTDIIKRISNNNSFSWSINYSLSDRPNELVGKLLSLSFIHLFVFILCSFWLKYNGINFDMKKQSIKATYGSKTRNDFSDSQNNNRPSKDILGLINALLEYYFNIITLSAIFAMAVIFSIVFPWYGMNSSF